MEIRTVAGRRATDRAGAAELGGVSRATINLRSNPAGRAKSGFPASLGKEDRRDWYPIDGDDGLEAHFRDQQTQRLTAAAAATRTPDGAPAWLRDGDPDELLPATVFRRAANIAQGTWKYYVQISKTAWDEGRDGYLPLPDDDEESRNGGTIYHFTRHRMIHWLDHRTGLGAGAGRKGADRPRINDAVDAVRADPALSGTALAAALGIELPGALYLLRRARERLAAEPH